MTLKIAFFYGTFTQTKLILVSKSSSITLLFRRLLTRFWEIIFICSHLASAPHLLYLRAEEHCTLFGYMWRIVLYLGTCACMRVFSFSHILS